MPDGHPLHEVQPPRRTIHSAPIGMPGSAAHYAVAFRPGIPTGEVIHTCPANGDRPELAVGECRLPPWARCFKRTVDLVLATALGLVAVPVLVLAMIAVSLDSRGPVIFKQVRLGAGGRRFTLFKLRTMVEGNDDSIHQSYVEALIGGQAEPIDGTFKLMTDPRITRVGRVLRRLSVDELPQLWNVLKGDMSLIGPRPPLPREAALYDAWTRQRLRMKPGLTGLWQVNGRCQRSFHEMVAYDIGYEESWSPWLDLKIVVRTPGAVLSRRGAR